MRAGDSMVQIDGDRLRVRFATFGLPEYHLFLKCKRLPESTIFLHEEDLTYTVEAPARFAPMLGLELPSRGAQDLPFAAHLHDDQAEVLRDALDAKRFALWAGRGWGKTTFALEWGRQISHRTGGGRVLFTTMADVVNEWFDEREKWYGASLPLLRIRSREHMRQWAREGDGRHLLAVTNYEKWNPESIDQQVVPEIKHLAGVGLDENRLKTGGGKQKWAIIKSCRGVEYKLTQTATPAPNELMEFASQASFLEKMRSEGEIIWTYFRRDEKTHRWTVKPHARQAFFEFLSTFSIYIDDPRRYGWRKDVPVPPEPQTFVHDIEPTPEQLGWLPLATADAAGQMSFLPPANGLNFVQSGRLSQVAKGFRYRRDEEGEYDRIPSRKPDFVARLVDQEVRAGHRVLVWTVFDAESEILAERLGVHTVPFVTLTGRTKPRDRARAMDAFRSGDCPVLMTRGSMIGWGVNLQCCTSMVYSGYDFSFEKQYQTEGRAYRQGQKQVVRFHFPMVRGLEDGMYSAIERKRGDYLSGIREMEDCYLRARRQTRGGAA